MPLAIPKTLSSERISAVCVGGAFFCAITCSVNATATGSTAPYRSAQFAKSTASAVISPRVPAMESATTPVIPSWMRESRIGSASREYTPTTATWSAQNTAHARTQGSPALTVKSGSTPRSRSPIPASTMPTHTGQPIRCRARSPRNGTNTT